MINSITFSQTTCCQEACAIFLKYILLQLRGLSQNILHFWLLNVIIKLHQQECHQIMQYIKAHMLDTKVLKINNFAVKHRSSIETDAKPLKIATFYSNFKK